jgi:diaminopimelate epimerase
VKTKFTKMSGAGNDFVLIDNRKGIIENGESLAQKLCDRRWGIGADGLLLLQPSSKADYTMMYYNADGSYGGMCGNGGRCIARYAVEEGIAKEIHSFEALSHIYQTRVKESEVALSMLDAADIRKNIVLPVNNIQLKAHFVNTGSPHVVIPIGLLKKKYGGLEKIPVDKIGRKLRNDKRFSPLGTNVNFIERNGVNSIRMRTYERGVEAETLACGTGSVASAIIASMIWKMVSPVQVVPSSGVDLSVSFMIENSNYTKITLTGQAMRIFDGEIDV